MKKIFITLLSLAAVSAYAGDNGKAPVCDAKAPVCATTTPCFNAGEWQVDLFGSGTYINDGWDTTDFYGGGIAFNYFYTQCIGVSASWNLIDVDNGGLARSYDTVVHDVSFDLILRAPLCDPESCTAVYGIIGGGFIADGTTLGTINFGVGLEHRLNDGLGLFVEARQKYVPAAEEDFTSVRTGVRVVF